MNWYIGVLKKYAEFSGRARRKEYWMFILFNVLIGFVLGILSLFASIFSVVASLYSLAILVPCIAVGVRRLHDIGRPGTHFLFILIPIVGAIMLLVWAAKEGVSGDNEYGPNPKA
jgi:uncharacterized membrane protein YhaH (DUF805 family)